MRRISEGLFGVIGQPGRFGALCVPGELEFDLNQTSWASLLPAWLMIEPFLDALPPDLVGGLVFARRQVLKGRVAKMRRVHCADAAKCLGRKFRIIARIASALAG